MDTEANVTRAQLDAAVAVARSEATSTANVAAIAAARTEAVASDRERISAVTSMPEAAGREALALQLALTGLTADQAKASLAAAPIAVAGGRAGGSEIGLSVEPKKEGNRAEASADWDKALTNRGMKVG